MRRTWFGIVTIAAMVVALLIACDNPTNGDASTGPSVDGVGEVTLTETVDPSDLGTVAGGTPPTGKNEVLDAIIAGVGLIGLNVGDFLSANDEWEPTSGQFTVTPEDLFDLQDIPESIGVTGSLTDETLDFADGTGNTGTISVSGSADAQASIAWDENIGDAGAFRRVDLEASLGEVIVTVSDARNGLEDVFVPAAKLAMAVNANLEIVPTYDVDGVPIQIDAAYATSAIILLAISVDSSLSSDPTGNFIASFGFGDDETISITEAMFEDPDALADYLEQRIQPNVLELAVERYDNDGDLQETYTYSRSDLLDYFEGLS